MHFYKHHIGDYAAATSHLSLIEDAIFSQLLRVYYRDERPLPKSISEVLRLINVRGVKPTRAKNVLARILREFFVAKKDGWHNKRCDEEIRAASKQKQANRAIAINREAAKRQSTIRARTVVEPSTIRSPPRPKTQDPDPRPKTETETADDPLPLRSVSVLENLHSELGRREPGSVLKNGLNGKPKHKRRPKMRAPPQIPEPAMLIETQEHRRERAQKAIRGLPNFGDGDLAKVARVTVEEIREVKSAATSAAST